MNPLLILAAAATLGVEVGWEPLADGGHEYTIEIEPQLLSVLKGGSDIVSEVPPHLDVRRYRITVGTAKLARVDGPPAAAPMRDLEPTVAATVPEPAPHVALPPPPEPEVPQETASVDEPPAHHLTADEAPQVDEPRAAEPRTREHATHEKPHTAAPATLPADDVTSKPLEGAQPAAHHAPIEEHSAEKPALEPSNERPWLPLSLAVMLLCCSLGGNVYLGWIAVEARRRYRQLAAKPRVLAP